MGLGLLTLRSPISNYDEWWLKAVCWGSGYQQVTRLGDDNAKTRENVWATFVECWIRHLGIPGIVVVDTGPEFQAYFADMLEAHGGTILPTDARSPWQNGRTERAGGEWKRQAKLARKKDEPITDKEYVALGQLCCAVRNRYNNRSGFSPTQRVYGFNHRLPNSLLSDDPIDPLNVNPLGD